MNEELGIKNEEFGPPTAGGVLPAPFSVIPTEGPLGPSGGIYGARAELRWLRPHRLVLSDAEGRVE